MRKSGILLLLVLVMCFVSTAGVLADPSPTVRLKDIAKVGSTQQSVSWLWAGDGFKRHRGFK